MSKCEINNITIKDQHEQLNKCHSSGLQTAIQKMQEEKN